MIRKSKQKTIWPVIVVMIGGIVTAISAVMRILHWVGHDYIKLAGLGIIIIGMVSFLITRANKAKE